MPKLQVLSTKNPTTTKKPQIIATEGGENPIQPTESGEHVEPQQWPFNLNTENKKIHISQKINNNQNTKLK